MKTNETQQQKELGTNPKSIEVKDRVVYYKGNERKSGTVAESFEENDVTKLKVSHDDGTEMIYKANDAKLDPLFFLNKETGKKTQTRFSYNEIVELIKGGKVLGLDYDAIGKSNVNSIIMGNKTGVIDNIQLAKKPEGDKPAETYNVSGRISVYVKEGKLTVGLDTKRQNLDVSQLYDYKFTKAEQEELLKSGELGLVSGFINKDTGEVFNAWVSVDRGLNKLVARPENSINVEKMYGRELTEKEQVVLKSGKGAFMSFENKNKEPFKVYIQVSAASRNLDGINKYPTDTAKKKGLKDGLAQEKKNTKTKGVTR